jgi:hypothetical protein
MYKHLIQIYLSFFLSIFGSVSAQIDTNYLPGWNGQVLIDCETAINWSVEHDAGSSGSLNIIPGITGNAVELNWNIGSGDWVQAKYTFPHLVDLSQKDIIGLSLRGSPGTGNRVSLMFADKNGVFFGMDFSDINTISRWMINLPVPKKMFYHFFTIPSDPSLTEIDWSQIDRFFLVVKRPNPLSGGGSGNLVIDHLQADRAADWTRQTDFDTVVVADSTPKNNAVSYVMSQQNSTTSLFVSWREEPVPKAHLYDQALTLILLTREGEWTSGTPVNTAAIKADNLVSSINSYQYTDGHWPRTWHASSGLVLADDMWVGDQAWWVTALMQYYHKSGDTPAFSAAHNGADWIISSSGITVPSSEGTLDIWWALMSTGHFDEADSVKDYLLTIVWDDSMLYWWRGYNDPVVAMDAATWISEFARTDIVGRADMAKAALSFVRRTLITTDDNYFKYGFDGMGPVSIWCEGTAQYVSAGGEDAQDFLDMLLTLQHSDGGMPGSTSNWSGTGFGWLSTWTGLSSTVWLYFALTESPFKTVDLPTSVKENNINTPSEFVLKQNYPNPFNPATVIEYSLSTAGTMHAKSLHHVILKIYDALGREVVVLVNKHQLSGNYRVQFSPDIGLSSGVYFYRLQAGRHFVQTRKMLLIR